MTSWKGMDYNSLNKKAARLYQLLWTRLFRGSLNCKMGNLQFSVELKNSYITAHISDHSVFHGPKSLAPNRTHFQTINESAEYLCSGIHNSGGGNGDSSNTSCNSYFRVYGKEFGSFAQMGVGKTPFSRCTVKVFGSKASSIKVLSGVTLCWSLM